MPTKTTTTWGWAYVECADRDYSMEDEGTNVLGLVSHSFRPNNGRFAYAAEGVRLPWVVTPGAGQGITFRELNSGYEGHHITYPLVIFKDIGPSQGATITAATLTFPGLTNDFVLSGKPAGNATVDMRAFGVKEPDYLGRVMVKGSAYAASYKAERWPQFGYPRRFRHESYDWQKQHTTAIVRWTVPSGGDFAVPDLVDVIQEIVNQNEWSASSRVALIVQTDGMTGGTHPPEEVGTLLGEGTGGDPDTGFTRRDFTTTSPITLAVTWA